MCSLIVIYKKRNIQTYNAYAQEPQLISRIMLPAYARGFGLPGTKGGKYEIRQSNKETKPDKKPGVSEIGSGNVGYV